MSACLFLSVCVCEVEMKTKEIKKNETWNRHASSCVDTSTWINDNNPSQIRSMAISPTMTFPKQQFKQINHLFSFSLNNSSLSDYLDLNFTSSFEFCSWYWPSNSIYFSCGSVLDNKTPWSCVISSIYRRIEVVMKNSKNNQYKFIW